MCCPISPTRARWPTSETENHHVRLTSHGRWLVEAEGPHNLLYLILPIIWIWTKQLKNTTNRSCVSKPFFWKLHFLPDVYTEPTLSADFECDSLMVWNDLISFNLRLALLSAVESGGPKPIFRTGTNGISHSYQSNAHRYKTPVKIISAKWRNSSGDSKLTKSIHLSLAIVSDNAKTK